MSSWTLRVEPEAPVDDIGGDGADRTVAGPRPGTEKGDRFRHPDAELGGDHPGGLVDPHLVAADVGELSGESVRRRLGLGGQHDLGGDAGEEHGIGVLGLG